MSRFLISAFIVLHGLVHLWYVTLSLGMVAFKPEMGWSGHSWLFSSLLGDSPTRSLASVLYVIATLLFVVVGISVFSETDWTRPVLLGAALFSSALILLFWDGSLHLWMEKGMIGLFINLALLAVVWLVRPSLLAG
jgi:hypothetical protein